MFTALTQLLADSVQWPSDQVTTAAEVHLTL